MNIVNLTPHALNLRTADGQFIVIPPSGSVSRVDETRDYLGMIDGLRVTRPNYGEVINLPAPQPGTIYIVSALVLQAVPDRADVFAPGPAIRDESGRVVGADGLSATPAYTPAGEDERIVGVGADGEPTYSNPASDKADKTDKTDDIPF